MVLHERRRNRFACLPPTSPYSARVDQPLPHTQRPILALILRLGAALMLAIMMVLVKLASESGIHMVEILFWRQLPTIPILLLWSAAHGSLALLKTRRLKAHGVRALYGIASLFFNFTGVTLLPLAEATVFTFTSTIWAVIFSALLLGEKVGPWRWSAVLLGFSGVLVIAQPGDGHIPLIGAACSLTAALLIGFISIQIRDLGRTEHPLATVFYFALFCIPMLAPFIPFVMTSHDAYQWGLLAGMGVTGLACQLLLVSALRLGTVASVTVMDYSGLIWAALFGVLVFDRLPPAATWIGAPLVIAAGILIAWREHRLAVSRMQPAASSQSLIAKQRF